MYIEYNPNPEKKNTSDCVVRGICKLTNQTWEKVYTDICLQGLMLHDMPDINYVWSGYLHSKGFRRYMLPDNCPYCYTVRQFCKEHPNGCFLLCLDGHVVAAKDGDYYDTWDSGDGVPLYYWRKEY